MVKFSDNLLEKTNVSESEIKSKHNKTLKNYVPLNYEVVTLNVDVIMASTFNTEGIYDMGDDWFNTNRGL